MERHILKHVMFNVKIHVPVEESQQRPKKNRTGGHAVVRIIDCQSCMLGSRTKIMKERTQASRKDQKKNQQPSFKNN